MGGKVSVSNFTSEEESAQSSESLLGSNPRIRGIVFSKMSYRQQQLQ